MDKPKSRAFDELVDDVLGEPKGIGFRAELRRQNTLRELGSAAIRKNLEIISSNARDKVKSHSETSATYRVVYFSLGGLQVFLSVVTTAMSGSRSFSLTPDILMQAIFILAIFGTVLSALLNFFGLEKKIADHHSTKCQYYDIGRDTAHFLRVEQTEDALFDFEGVLVEREKFILQYEPPLSGCCV